MDPKILREYVRNIRNRYAELELSEEQDYELDETRRFLTDHFDRRTAWADGDDAGQGCALTRVLSVDSAGRRDAGW